MQTELSREKAELFIKELTELSEKHGMWLHHHWDTIIVGDAPGAVGYDWELCDTYPQLYVNDTTNRQGG